MSSKSIQLISLVVLAALGLAVALFLHRAKEPPVENSFSETKITHSEEPQAKPPAPEESPQKVRLQLPESTHSIVLPKQVFQTFNNCGPATLSMMLAFYGIDKSQAELGKLIRPYQNPRGDNDDKSTSSEEFIYWANQFGLKGIVRPAGNIEKIKLLITNGFPVVVRTWLRVNEDIGHYRIIRGFDEAKKVVIQNDSYFGKDKEIPYQEFLAMWQPLHYEYFVLYPEEKEALVAAMLGEDFDEKTAWQNAYRHAQAELDSNPGAVYPIFNLVVANYYLGRFQDAVREFEKIETRLPARMLWYQIEPVLAYHTLGWKERVFALTNKILNNNNRAFSELYQIRGEIYLQEGKLSEAKQEFELAVRYKENFEGAITALAKLR